MKSLIQLEAVLCYVLLGVVCSLGVPRFSWEKGETTTTNRNDKLLELEQKVDAFQGQVKKLFELSPHSGCPKDDTWKYSKGQCYKFMANQNGTWQQANETCRSMGGHLAAIYDEATNKLLLDLAKPYVETMKKYLKEQGENFFQFCMWIGLNDWTYSGTDSWDGASTTNANTTNYYSNVRSFEENVFKSMKNRRASWYKSYIMFYDGTWGFSSYNTKWHFFCQKDAWMTY